MKLNDSDDMENRRVIFGKIDYSIENIIEINAIFQKTAHKKEPNAGSAP